MKTHEKIAIVVLVALLLAGALLLHFRASRPFAKLTVQHNTIPRQLSLEEVQKSLEEERRVDPNTATIDELTSIPGIGDTLAARIIEYRNKGGVFYSERDLLEVEGIGDKKLKKIREYIKFE